MTPKVKHVSLSSLLDLLSALLEEFWNAPWHREIAVVFPHDPEDVHAYVEIRFFELTKHDVLRLAKLAEERGLYIKVEPVEDYVETYVRVEVRA